MEPSSGGTRSGAHGGILRASVVVQLIAALTLVGRADGEEAEWLPDQPFVEGRRVFEEKGCGACHGGRARGEGPDLRRGRTSTDAMRLAGSLWNHVPLASRAGDAQGAARATLSPEEAGKLAGYLFQLSFVDQPGDVARGRLLFEQRACARCHQLGGRGGTVGPRLDELAPYATAVFLAEALWSHGTRMVAKMEELGIARPALEAEDVDHLLAFLRGRGEVSASLERVAAQTGNPRAGRAVFVRHGCVRCHAIDGVGGDAAADLGLRRPGWRLAAVVAALWNHGPAMWAAMDARAIAVPQLTDREMADVLAYLFFLQFADTEGDAARGATLFRDRSCGLCHAAAAGDEHTGPSLPGSAARSPLHWMSAMWNHAPAVEDALRERGLPWPRLEGDELRDVAAFLRPSGKGR